MKLEYKLGKVHCAGCASALEEILSKLDGVEKCSLNFISNLLVLEIENKNHKQIEENVKAAIHKFDKNIELLDPHAEEKISRKKKIYEILNYTSIALSFVVLVVLFAVSMPFWLHLSLSIFAYLIVGWNVLYLAGRNIIQGKVLDENFLMTIATIGAFILGEFSEAVAVMLFYQVGEMFNHIAVKNSEREIKSIACIKAESACLVLDNTEMIVTLDKVDIGDIIRVKPGEKVPLDGKIIEGETYVDSSALTGESQEKFLRVGDEILSGMIVSSGVVLVEVTKLEHESTVSKIIELVENSSVNKSKTEKFISKFAKVYTPIVVFLAIFIGFVMPIFWLYSNFTVWLYRALTFLVVSCPCALVISIPLGFFAGLGACARHGVLVKGANYLEALANANTIIFDKTGTLTYGNFKISNIVGVDDKPEDEILEFIAYGEKFSNHRIAKSIVDEYKRRTNNDINLSWINGASEIAGVGVQANIFGIDCLVGNAKLLRDNNVEFQEVNSPYTVVYLSQNGTFAGYIEVKDEVREDAKETIDNLKSLGITRTAMFTGDRDEVAKVVSESIGLNCYHANLLPKDKVSHLLEHKNSGSLIFVGDGINDAPILASVDVGVALGGVGSDVAIEASDIVLANDNLKKIPLSVAVAKKTKRIVLENIIFALGIKVAVLVLSALGLANMWLAIFADVGVSILAVLNSIRALIVPIKYREKKNNNKLNTLQK